MIESNNVLGLGLLFFTKYDGNLLLLVIISQCQVESLKSIMSSSDPKFSGNLISISGNANDVNSWSITGGSLMICGIQNNHHGNQSQQSSLQPLELKQEPIEEAEEEQEEEEEEEEEEGVDPAAAAISPPPLPPPPRSSTPSPISATLNVSGDSNNAIDMMDVSQPPQSLNNNGSNNNNNHNHSNLNDIPLVNPYLNPPNVCNVSTANRA